MKRKSIKELLEFGIINVDKPAGPTSFEVSEKVKMLLGLRKTSHFGTLDPQVTGVLPIALNRACKLTGFFIGHDKTYVGIMRFHEDIKRERVEEAIAKNFIGVITQLPPVRSRVARRERKREIKSFEILEQQGKDFVFRCAVQGGTYIRKLIDDLGKTLGVGAHMLELRRTQAGIFDESKSVTLYELEKSLEAYKQGNEKLLYNLIITGEIVATIYPQLELKKEHKERVLRGAPIQKDFLEIKKDLPFTGSVVVFCKKQLIGVFDIVNQEKTFAKSLFTLQPL